MIDSLAVAEAFHDEAKTHVQGMRFSPPESDLGFEKNWERQVARWPLPERGRLATIIEHVFWTSLLTEEGRPSRPRLVYAPSRESGYVVHWFTEAKPLTPATLAKLAPACGPLNYLAWHLEAGSPLLTGIVSHQGAAPFDLIVAAAGTGAVDLIWNGYRLVTLRSGELARCSQNRLPNAGVRSPYLAELLGNVSSALLERAVRVIADQGHGGSLWIVRDRASLVHSGIHIGIEVRDAEVDLLDRAHDERLRWLESVGHLASVDGAVVLDGDARLIGFGAFADSTDDIVLARIHPSGVIAPTQASELGAGRHRSAAHFCSQCAPAVAYVVSEDGRISFLAAEKTGQPPLCAEIVSLGFSVSEL